MFCLSRSRNATLLFALAVSTFSLVPAVTIGQPYRPGTPPSSAQKVQSQSYTVTRYFIVYRYGNSDRWETGATAHKTRTDAENAIRGYYQDSRFRDVHVDPRQVTYTRRSPGVEETSRSDDLPWKKKPTVGGPGKDHSSPERQKPIGKKADFDQSPSNERLNKALDKLKKANEGRMNPEDTLKAIEKYGVEEFLRVSACFRG